MRYLVFDPISIHLILYFHVYIETSRLGIDPMVWHLIGLLCYASNVLTSVISLTRTDHSITGTGSFSAGRIAARMDYLSNYLS